MRLFSAALLLALFPECATQAGDLGRLFFTPEQRAQLEHRHTHSATADDSDAPPMLVVNGIVQKLGGARTVWLNGVARNSSQSEEPATEAVAVPEKSKTLKIKTVKILVGQKLLLDTAAPQSTSAPAE